jgi:probable F420-dependent oxidoreductase
MTTTDELRQLLGPAGLWMPPPAAIGLDPEEFARTAEDAGFGSIWVPGVNAAENLAALEPLLAATKRLVVATGIASVWTWSPAELAAAADRLTADYSGRFILGLGVSHAPLVESTGQAYERPLAKMRQFLDELPPLESTTVLAALGPKMLQLSRDRTHGAHPYFVPPEHTVFARSVLGTEPLLIPELAVALAPGAAGAAAAREYAKYYLRLPNYTSNLRRLGFGDEDLADGGSDRLMSAVVPHGPEAVSARLREHLDAGADHVLVQPVGEDGRFRAADIGEIAAIAAGLAR